MSLPRLLGLVALLAHGGLASAPAPGGPPAPRPLLFEAEFREETGPAWKRRWAQAKVESGLNPAAKSPVGAQGLTQFMPRSWQRAIQQGWVPAGASPLEPRMAIRAQHGYMGWLEGFFRDQRKAWGGYNAGEGNIQRADRLAKALGLQGRDAWMRALPRVTGAHASETLAYIPRIERALLMVEGR